MAPATRLVIFDNDGVLVDSEPLSNAVMANVLSELGIPTTPQRSMARFMGRSLPDVRATIASDDGIELPADFEATYSARLADLFVAELSPVAGMRSVVEAVVDAGVAHCVASSGGHGKIRLTHRLVGFDGLFEGVRFSADDVTRGKPEPDLFLYAAARMGVEPADCIVIEDSAAGVEAAGRAAMACVGFAARTDPGLLVDASLGTVSSADELPPLLGL